MNDEEQLAASRIKAARTELHRKLTPGEKWLLLGELWTTAREIHARTVRQFIPEATPDEILEYWMRLTLGEELAEKVFEVRYERRRKGL